MLLQHADSVLTFFSYSLSDMNDAPPSRRRFLRQGLTLAGATFAWSSIIGRTFAAGNTAAAAIPRANISNPDQALQELNAGNLRYVTGTHLHRYFGPERAA